MLQALAKWKGVTVVDRFFEDEASNDDVLSVGRPLDRWVVGRVAVLPDLHVQLKRDGTFLQSRRELVREVVVGERLRFFIAQVGRRRLRLPPIPDEAFVPRGIHILERVQAAVNEAEIAGGRLERENRLEALHGLGVLLYERHRARLIGLAC